MADLMARAALLALGTLLLEGLPASAGDGADLQVHMLSGSGEYRSDASLKRWANHLQEAYGIAATLSAGPDRATGVAGLDHLAQADILVVFCRRWELDGESADRIQAFLDSRRPVLGIRTASHAFQFVPGFDRDVLGGDYAGHGDGGRAITVRVAAGAGDHPILQGVTGWQRVGKPYWNPGIAEDVRLLMEAEVDGRVVPLTWAREADGRRVFYTSMGLPADFGNPLFIRLLDNALFWLAGTSPPWEGRK